MFGIFVAWTIIYLANEWLQPVALKKEFPDSLEKEVARIQQCSSFTCVDAMKGHKGKIHKQPVTTATKNSNWLVDWLWGGPIWHCLRRSLV